MMAVPSANYVNMYPDVGGVAGAPVGNVEMSWAGITDIRLNAGDEATGYNLGLWDTGL
jgi:hypothetical protein